MKCTAQIEVAGAVYQCERNLGDEHFLKESMHETTITDPGGSSGLIVRWLQWRRVQPAASGC